MWIYTLKLISTSVETENRKYTSDERRTKKDNKMKNVAEKPKKPELFYKTRGTKYGRYNHNTAIL